MPASLLTVTPLTASGISHVGFNPSSFTGLSLWLDASIITATSGTSLATWSARSGANAVQASAGSQPLFLGNAQSDLGVVSFSSGGKAFLTSATSGANCKTIALAFRSRFSASQNFIFGGTTNALPSVFNSGGASSYFVYQGSSILASSTSTVNTWYTLTLLASGSSTTVSLSGVTRFGNIGVTAPDITMNIGAVSAAAQYLNGEVGEVVCYDRLLVESDRAQLESYLSTRWGT